MSSGDKKFGVALALVCVLAAGALLYLRQTLDGAGPRSAVRYHVGALTRGDLETLKTSATPELYLQYQTEASEPAFESAREMFTREIPAYAEPIWRRIRDEARSKASEEYEALRPRVLALGRGHYQTLSGPERAQIVQSGEFEQALFRFGVERLSPEEKNRIRDSLAFYRRSDKRRYILSQAFRHLSPELQSQLQDPTGLADEDTLAKLAYYDSIATKIRERHPGVERGDVVNLRHFVSKHGEKHLTEQLAMASVVIPGADRTSCDSPAFSVGYLLHGPNAFCRAAGDITFGLQRARFEWLVSGKDGFTIGPSR